MLVEYAAKQEEERVQRHYRHACGNRVGCHANVEVMEVAYRLQGIASGPSRVVVSKDERQQALNHVAREEPDDGGQRQRHSYDEVASDEFLLGSGWQHEVVDALLTGLEVGEDARTCHHQINAEGEQGGAGGAARGVGVVGNHETHGLRNGYDGEEDQGERGYLALAERELPAEDVKESIFFHDVC